jgi:two-component system, cell cycle sensor histidine kinase and response regulator CckA
MPNIETVSTPAAPAQWWRRLFESSEDAQLVCRADGWIEEANPRACRLLGFGTQRPGPQSNVPDLLTAGPRQKLLHLLAQNKPGQQVIAEATVLAHGRPCLAADLQVTAFGDGHFLVTLKDASRRQRLEAHVQRLAAAMDATPDVFFLTDGEFRLTYVNPAFQTCTGYNIEEALGRPADFLRAPSESARLQEYLEAVRRGRDWSGNLLNLRKSGSAYPVEATVSPIQGLHGDFLGYVSCERDITLKRRLQEELLLERDLARGFSNSHDAAIYTVDGEFRLIHANDGWKRFPGEHGWLWFRSAPCLGEPLLESVPDPSHRARLRLLFQSVLAEDRPQEICCSSADGRHWLIRVLPWTHAGKISGLIYHVADHTQVRELQGQLYQAQKMDIIGTLATGVAHDFNNLLQAICGNCGLLLLDARLPAELRPTLEQIDLASTRACEITQQLLSFSRASEERVTVLDFNQIIREASHLARRLLRSNIVLELRPMTEPAKVRMDATRANQLLLNLCVNAQDAMPGGGSLVLSNERVCLSAAQAARTPYPAGTAFVCCKVADTGQGIPPEVLPRIFDPFFTTKSRGKGTGLGLAIVQRVVQQAEGFIDVESQPGQGTTFLIYLPLAEEPVTAAPKPAARTLRRGSGRVLVVDDMDLVRDFTRSFLEAAGFTVLLAVDGPQALDLLEKQAEPVDVLLTDYSMPGMNGLELVERVIPRWPHTRLVLASGYLDEDCRARIHDLGVHLLEKPYDMQDAVSLITEALTAE